MRLHVRIVRAEQLFDPVDGEHLDLVYVLTPPVVPHVGITFRVFVGEHRALRLEHSGRCVVLRRNQLHVLLLPTVFFRDRRCELVVETGDAVFALKHANPEKVTAKKRRYCRGASWGAHGKPFSSAMKRLPGVDAITHPS